jgi:basic membrane lipoprotein Med (substrate-binding protein (PBP1-ABC) superfamily)
MWQHIYLAGIMAGAATKSNKLGLITYSTDSNSAITMLTAYKAGAQAANPKAEVIHVATGSFSDLAVGKEMAISLMDQGCDVILCNSGDCNVTVMETCAEKKVYSIGAIVDHNDVSADYVLGSAMLPPSNILRIMVKGFLEGSLKGSADVVIMGLKGGAEEFRINPTMKTKLDKSVFDMIDKATADINSGAITIKLP